MEYNDLIHPLERSKSKNDFSNALEIARLCGLGEPVLTLSSDHGLNFESGYAAGLACKTLLISTDRSTLSARSLIAVLTSLDAATVIPLSPGSDSLLVTAKELIWSQASHRGDYQRQLDSDPEIAGLVGAIIGSAISGATAIIDGVDAYAATLLAQRLAFRSIERCLAAAPPTDPAIKEAQNRLRLPTVLSTAISQNAVLVAYHHLRNTVDLSS